MSETPVQSVRGRQDCLIDLQRHLMSNGYTYVSGSPYEWPLPYVVMIQGQDVVMIGPARELVEAGGLRIWENLGQSNVPRGLVVVGEADELAWFDEQCGRGSRARVELHSGRVTVTRQGPTARICNKRRLGRLLESEPPEGMDASTCRAALQRNLDELQASQSFYEKADRAARPPAPLMTYTLIGACLMLFAAMIVGEGFSVALNPTEDILFDWGAMYGPAIKGGQWWRILSAGFLHIGIFHLAFNMYALGVFGTLLERLQGRERLATIYACSLLTSALGSLLWHPSVLSAGASGGIFGLIGGVIALLVRHRRDFPSHMRNAIRKWLMTILLYNVVLMALLYRFIDNAAHIGGLVGGLLVGLAITRSPVRREKIRGWQIAVLAGLVPLLVAGGVWAWQRIPEPQRVKPWHVVERSEAAVLGAEAAVDRIEPLMERASSIWTPLADEQARPKAEDLDRLRRILGQLEHIHAQIASPRELGAEAPVLAAGKLASARNVAQAAVVTVRRAVNALVYRATEDAPRLPRWDSSDPYHQALAAFRSIAEWPQTP